MSDLNRIPSPIIGVLGEIFSEYYTHAEIERLFAFADAPVDAPEGNKVQKTVDWLKLVNRDSANPLDVLGSLLEELLEKEPEESPHGFNASEAPWSVNLRKHQARILASLSKANLSYEAGGHIAMSSATPAKSLRETVSKGGLKAIEIEMNRALKIVDSDPNGAAHYAGNILEASLKAYLDHKKINFNDQKATLSDLWQLVRDNIGLKPQDMPNNDLKKIASGLNSIVDGTMFIRNKKSGAHGRTEEQTKTNVLRPRHARLVVHSAHTVSMYVLECMAD